MGSSVHIEKPSKLVIILAIAWVAFVILVVCLYLNSRADAIAKTQPYAIELEVVVKQDGAASVFYDYGYGFNDGHQRKLALLSQPTPQFIHFSVSAWKQIKGLSFHGFDEGNARLITVNIKKGVQRYSLTFDNSVIVSSGSQIIIDDIQSKLEKTEQGQ